VVRPSGLAHLRRRAYHAARATPIVGDRDGFDPPVRTAHEGFNAAGRLRNARPRPGGAGRPLRNRRTVVVPVCCVIPGSRGIFVVTHEESLLSMRRAKGAGVRRLRDAHARDPAAHLEGAGRIGSVRLDAEQRWQNLQAG